MISRDSKRLQECQEKIRFKDFKIRNQAQEAKGTQLRAQEPGSGCQFQKRQIHDSTAIGVSKGPGSFKEPGVFVARHRPPVYLEPSKNPQVSLKAFPIGE